MDRGLDVRPAFGSAPRVKRPDGELNPHQKARETLAFFACEPKFFAVSRLI